MSFIYEDKCFACNSKECKTKTNNVCKTPPYHFNQQLLTNYISSSIYNHHNMKNIINCYNKNKNLNFTKDLNYNPSPIYRDLLQKNAVDIMTQEINMIQSDICTFLHP